MEMDEGGSYDSDDCYTSDEEINDGIIDKRDKALLDITDKAFNKDVSLLFYKRYIEKAASDIKRIEKNQAEAIEEINTHFDSVQQRIQEERCKLVESVAQFSSARISCIQECAKRAQIQFDECSKLTGDPTTTIATTTNDTKLININAFFDENVYDVTLPIYKSQKVSDADLHGLKGTLTYKAIQLNRIPAPRDIKIRFNSPVSGTLVWDKSHYYALFDKLNSIGDIKYEVNDIKFPFKVNNEKIVQSNFIDDIHIKLVPGKKYVVDMVACYNGVESQVVRYEFVSKEVSPEYYQGKWDTSNPQGYNPSVKEIKKLESNYIPALFTGDIPLNSQTNNYWAFHFSNDSSPEKVLLAGLIPKYPDDVMPPVDEGFFSAVQKGWFVSVHTGLLLGSEAAQMPNGRTCKMVHDKKSYTISMGFDVQNKCLVFGNSIAEVRDALKDDRKIAFKGLPGDVPLYPAVIVASSSITTTLCFPS